MRKRRTRFTTHCKSFKFAFTTNGIGYECFGANRLIIRLWTLIFSGSPRKIREEEIESARKSVPANVELKNGPKDEGTEGAPPMRPDDEDIDPNDLTSSSTFGKPQVAPEVDWENPFDEDEEDDY